MGGEVKSPRGVWHHWPDRVEIRRTANFHFLRQKNDWEKKPGDVLGRRGESAETGGTGYISNTYLYKPRGEERKKERYTGEPGAYMTGGEATAPVSRRTSLLEEWLAG